jgi:hypothetical protein
MTDHSDGYRCEAGEADRSRCGRGEVDDPPAYERAPIVDANHDRTVRAIVSDTYQGAEGQRAMRRREASTSRVHGGNSGLTVGDTREDGGGSRKYGGKKHTFRRQEA